MFEDRKDAGIKLAKALGKYKGKGVLVLAIPRGGVQVGLEVAKHLEADFSILVARKLPYPNEPEAGFGAIAEDGSIVMLEDAAQGIPKRLVDDIIKGENAEIKRRIAVLRNGRPLPPIKDRTVILVDDGIAMGSTIRASIILCRNFLAKKIVVAVPVAGENARGIEPMVDELIVLEKPIFFRAVAQVYRNWHDVSDEEVLTLMKEWQNSHL